MEAVFNQINCPFWTVKEKGVGMGIYNNIFIEIYNKWNIWLYEYIFENL